MTWQEFIASLSRGDRYLLGLYVVSGLALLLTQALIAKQEVRVEELRKMNEDAWEI